jgi:hypothetical protein
MEVKELQEHIDKRLDALEFKIDRMVPTVAMHSAKIAGLKTFNKYVVSVFLSVVGFLALAFFNKG